MMWRGVQNALSILFRSVDVIAAKKTTTGRRPTCYKKKPSSYSAAGHVLFDKRQSPRVFLHLLYILAVSAGSEMGFLFLGFYVETDKRFA
jgi:hypothetical protein